MKIMLIMDYGLHANVPTFFFNHAVYCFPNVGLLINKLVNHNNMICIFPCIPKIYITYVQVSHHFGATLLVIGRFQGFE